MAKFPDKPTQDEQTALFSYIHLFARLYPCGECASHFRAILSKFPPQVSTRSSAAAWACHVHNEVNKSLEKDVFDCSKIGDFYDCGCAKEVGEGKQEKAEKPKVVSRNMREVAAKEHLRLIERVESRRHIGRKQQQGRGSICDSRGWGRSGPSEPYDISFPFTRLLTFYLSQEDRWRIGYILYATG